MIAGGHLGKTLLESWSGHPRDLHGGVVDAAWKRELMAELLPARSGFA